MPRLLSNLADVTDADSLANRLRARRFERFEHLSRALPRPLRIIDLGGTAEFWRQRGWADRDGVRITLVNLQTETTDLPHNVRAIQGDVTNLRHLPNDAFDVAFSNSVIEHLFTWEGQQRMAAEIKRLAPAYWIQTPNFWFPMEPHFLVPGWQWLPIAARVAVLRCVRCGSRGPCGSKREASQAVREIRLLRKRELRTLFPVATIEPERFGGIVKSWIVHHGFHADVHQRRQAA